MRDDTRLRKLIRECGMTQPGVAKTLGIDREKVRRVCYGRDDMIPGLIESLEAIRLTQENCRLSLMP